MDRFLWPKVSMCPNCWTQLKETNVIDDSKDPSKGKRKPGLGAKASSARKRLEVFEERKRRIEDELREERQRLTTDLTDAERRENRRKRNEEMNRLKRVKFILGGLVVSALREEGEKALAFATKHLGRLKPEERQLIAEALASLHPPSGPGPGPSSIGGSSGDGAAEVS
jgi:hypothetical protein